MQTVGRIDVVEHCLDSWDALITAMSVIAIDPTVLALKQKAKWNINFKAHSAVEMVLAVDAKVILRSCFAVWVIVSFGVGLPFGPIINNSSTMRISTGRREEAWPSRRSAEVQKLESDICWICCLDIKS